jgi:hypothetical protein
MYFLPKSIDYCLWICDESTCLLLSLICFQNHVCRRISPMKIESLFHLLIMLHLQYMLQCNSGLYFERIHYFLCKFCLGQNNSRLWEFNSFSFEIVLDITISNYQHHQGGLHDCLAELIQNCCPKQSCTRRIESSQFGIHRIFAHHEWVSESSQSEIILSQTMLHKNDWILPIWNHFVLHNLSHNRQWERRSIKTFCPKPYSVIEVGFAFTSPLSPQKSCTKTCRKEWQNHLKTITKIDVQMVSQNKAHQTFPECETWENSVNRFTSTGSSSMK